MNKLVLLMVVFALNAISLTAAAVSRHGNFSVILSKSEKKLLIIDEKSGDEKVLDIGSKPVSVVTNGDHAYVLDQGLDSVWVVNLLSGKTDLTIGVGYEPFSITLFKNYGFVLNNMSDTLSVIDLASKTLKSTVKLAGIAQWMVVQGKYGYIGTYPGLITILDLDALKIKATLDVIPGDVPMVIAEDMGYVLNTITNEVAFIDLTKQALVKTLPVGGKPVDIAIHGKYGYVVDQGSDTVSVIDLKGFSIKKQIQVGVYPQKFIIHGKYGYVTNFSSDDVSVIDLSRQTLHDNIDVGRNPKDMVIEGDHGYVFNTSGTDVDIIDLEKNEAVKQVKKPKGVDVDLSRTRFYFGVKEAGVLAGRGSQVVKKKRKMN